MTETPDQIAYRIVHYSSGPGDIFSSIAREIADEREACARIASTMEASGDCDERGMQDPETGEIIN